MTYSYHCADIVKWAAAYSGPPFHAVFCDAPYNLDSIEDRFGDEDAAPAKPGTDGVYARASRGFMGKRWDSEVAFDPETWRAIARHLLPGGFIIAYGGSRTFHRMATAMEDAGLIIHPTMTWNYGSGFPKATNISRALEKTLCDVRLREDGRQEWFYKDTGEPIRKEAPFRHPDADRWSGHRYGKQALKPAAEYIVLAQRPHLERRLDEIVTTGAGALSIDGTRISSDNRRALVGLAIGYGADGHSKAVGNTDLGRWPANVVLSHTPDCHPTGEFAEFKGDAREGGGSGGLWSGESNHQVGPGYGDADGRERVEIWECAEGCPVAALDRQSGTLTSGTGAVKKASGHGWKGGSMGGIESRPPGTPNVEYGDTGGASRFFTTTAWAYEVEEHLADCDPFFYVAKASTREREAGLHAREAASVTDGRQVTSDFPKQRGMTLRRNPHPTVKPIALNKWLASLLLPPADYSLRRILIPFGGVASEAIGAMLAGWDEITIVELEQEYVDVGVQRLDWWFGRMQHKGSTDPIELLRRPAVRKDRPASGFVGRLFDD
jgi:hypothetical protein